jgi:hypothetical protein
MNGLEAYIRLLGGLAMSLKKWAFLELLNISPNHHISTHGIMIGKKERYYVLNTHP